MFIKTILTATTLFAFSVWPTLAGPSLTVMEPISGRDERQVSIDEVKENIRSSQDSDARFERAEAYEDRRRVDLEERSLSRDAERDIYCLTEAIYFESLGEPEQGKIAVANVIMNRANWTPDDAHRNKHHYEFSKSICDVVNFKLAKTYSKKIALGKKKKRSYKYVHRTYTTCAFSYRCERGFHSKLERVKKKPVWNEIKTLATDTYLSYNSGANEDPTSGATFYHATYVSPKWRKDYKKTTKIGLHIFYRIP